MSDEPATFLHPDVIFFIDIPNDTTTVDGVTKTFDHQPFVGTSKNQAPPNAATLDWKDGSGYLTFQTPGMEPITVNNYSRYREILLHHKKLSELPVDINPPEEVVRYNALLASRDKILNDTDWIYQRESEQAILKIGSSLTPEEYSDILLWRQLLRDLPKKHPTSETWLWPNKPEILNRLLATRDLYQGIIANIPPRPEYIDVSLNETSDN